MYRWSMKKEIRIIFLWQWRNQFFNISCTFHQKYFQTQSLLHNLPNSTLILNERYSSRFKFWKLMNLPFLPRFNFFLDKITEKFDYKLFHLSNWNPSDNKFLRYPKFLEINLNHRRLIFRVLNDEFLSLFANQSGHEWSKKRGGGGEGHEKGGNNRVGRVNFATSSVTRLEAG